MRNAIGIGCCLAVLILAGCGSSSLTEVTGKVMIDGQPLEEGEIIFEEADLSKAPVSAKIAKGEYKAAVPPGNKKVRIQASRPTGKPDPVMGSTARESMIAPEFNVNSTLTHKVESSPQKDVNFEVKARPPS